MNFLRLATAKSQECGRNGESYDDVFKLVVPVRRTRPHLQNPTHAKLSRRNGQRAAAIDNGAPRSPSKAFS